MCIDDVVDLLAVTNLNEDSTNEPILENKISKKNKKKNKQKWVDEFPGKIDFNDFLFFFIICLNLTMGYFYPESYEL